MFIINRYKNIDFGIKPVYDVTFVKMTVVFCVGYLVYYVMWYFVFGFLMNAIGGYSYELNPKNVIGTLCFQLLISGTMEELLFRAIPITLFTATCDERSRTDNTVIIAITSLLFTCAHFNHTIPFVSQWYSLLYVCISGIIFGVVYLKTKSAIYPIIIHGVSNFISVAGCYIYMTTTK